MVVVDTNVISELFRPSPSVQVLQWFHSQPQSLMHTTAVTLADVFAGLESMPRGHRRTDLTQLAEELFARDFAGRILDFDESAARAYARILTARRSAGRPMSSMDAMIAAIAVSRKATLATRNTSDFEDCGLHLLNPWGD